MAAFEIHANSCLPELVYGNPYSAGLVLVFMRTQPYTNSLCKLLEAKKVCSDQVIIKVGMYKKTAAEMLLINITVCPWCN